MTPPIPTFLKISSKIVIDHISTRKHTKTYMSRESRVKKSKTCLVFAPKCQKNMSGKFIQQHMDNEAWSALLSFVLSSHTPLSFDTYLICTEWHFLSVSWMRFHKSMLATLLPLRRLQPKRSHSVSDEMPPTCANMCQRVSVGNWIHGCDKPCIYYTLK